MDDFIKWIWELRNDEGMPIYFRRNWQGNYHRKPIWYIWYGYKQIAWRANLKNAEEAVYVAMCVHRAIHE